MKRAFPSFPNGTRGQSYNSHVKRFLAVLGALSLICGVVPPIMAKGAGAACKDDLDMAQLYDSLHDKGETEEDVRLHILTDFGHGVDQSAADAWTTEVLHQIEILGVVYHTVDDADRQKAIRYQIILGCVRRAMEDQLHKQGK